VLLSRQSEFYREAGNQSRLPIVVPFDDSNSGSMKTTKTPKISRRSLFGRSLGSTAALLTGTASAAQIGAGDSSPDFKTSGERSMTLQEFRALNGEGSVARLMGSMDCDLLAKCHKQMKDKEGIWIPELVPLLNEIDTRTHSNVT
jgi:hypothetical protein